MGMGSVLYFVLGSFPREWGAYFVLGSFQLAGMASKLVKYVGICGA